MYIWRQANKIYKKPWGSEYLAYQNTEIGIWILKINKGMETSVHCHFKKDTILICLSGSFKIKLYDSFKILNILSLTASLRGLVVEFFKNLIDFPFSVPLIILIFIYYLPTNIFSIETSFPI